MQNSGLTSELLVSFDNRFSFVEPTLNLSENFSQITDVKFVLFDETDPENPVQEAQLIESISSFYDDIPGRYVINFNEDLNDGSYQVVVMDDAGNRVEGVENQIFSIDTTAPEFSGAIDLGSTDLGRFKQNILYTAADLENGTIPVGKSVGDIKIATDRLTSHTSPEITFVAEAGLRTFISYDNLSGDVTTLPDPFAQEDTPGFREPIYAQSYSNGIYTINFNNGVILQDGRYTLTIEDDAGNQIVGTSEQRFEIETEKQ